MLLLDYRHSEFDLHMEILCSVPPYPGYVMEKDLVQDFGLLNKRSLHQYVQAINKKFDCLARRKIKRGVWAVSLKRSRLGILGPLIEAYSDMVDPVREEPLSNGVDPLEDEDDKGPEAQG